ncbi:Tat binding protein 1-interacting [Gorgonomyces haynaldii]|nr:Tat binding protein 1-interacting [Gorgonomyces haynaldii]
MGKAQEQSKVMDWFIQQNRPMSVQTIMQYAKESTKSQIEKQFEQAAKKGTIQRKEFSKQAIFFPHEAVVEGSVKDMKSKVSELKSKNENLRKQKQELEKKVQALKSVATPEELQAKINHVQTQKEELLKKLESYQQKENKREYTPEEKQQMQQQHQQLTKALKNRKRIFKDCWGVMTENASDNPKKLAQTIGIEL